MPNKEDNTALERDAKRYRFLRDCARGHNVSMDGKADWYIVIPAWARMRARTCDEAIDKAMTEVNKQSLVAYKRKKTSMRVSQLIEALQKILQEDGDYEVAAVVESRYSVIEEVQINKTRNMIFLETSLD